MLQSRRFAEAARMRQVYAELISGADSERVGFRSYVVESIRRLERHSDEIGRAEREATVEALSRRLETARWWLRVWRAVNTPEARRAGWRFREEIAEIEAEIGELEED